METKEYSPPIQAINMDGIEMANRIITTLEVLGPRKFTIDQIKAVIEMTCWGIE